MFGPRSRDVEMKRSAPPVYQTRTIAENPMINPKERQRPTTVTGNETVFGEDRGGGAYQTTDMESFAAARSRSFTIGTMSTSAGAEYRMDGLNAGGSARGGGMPANMTEHYDGSRTDGVYAQPAGITARGGSKVPVPAYHHDGERLPRGFTPTISASSAGGGSASIPPQFSHMVPTRGSIYQQYWTKSNAVGRLDTG